MKAFIFALLVATSVPALGQGASEHAGHADTAAPKAATILDGYGAGGFKVDTANPEAQAFFNNGMQLAHAFAHDASIGAMKEAVRLDPKCAMCRWGEAWASGPTINYELDASQLALAIKLAAKAKRMARAKGSPLERALTNALVRRYRNGGGGKPGDLAFAQTMERLAAANPASDVIATLAADAWMQAPSGDEDVDGGQLYRENNARAVALLEPVLARNPSYSPAIHFYIHSTEESGVGPKAEPFADRLGALAPKSQHLVHMPSHTLYWVGRYADAARVNRRAVEIGIAQSQLLTGKQPDGVWGLPYHAHNVTFGLGGALMAGDAETALWLGRPLVEKATTQTKAGAFAQALGGSGYIALAEFAEPIEVLKVMPPRLPYLLGMWRYARAEARARQGDIRSLRAEAAAIIIPAGEKKEDGSWQGGQTLRIAKEVLEARALMMERKPVEAVMAFRRGAELQEQAYYSKAADPPLWWFPVRRSLAEAQLAAGDHVAARSEAEATLKVRPKDPGALALLAKLEALGGAR